jgi:hypothetical protein
VVDGFVGDEAVELKPTADKPLDGCGGLAPAQHRLLAAGACRLLFISLRNGLIGEPVEMAQFLAIARRLDGIPVGQVRLDWQPTGKETRSRTRT